MLSPHDRVVFAQGTRANGSPRVAPAEVSTLRNKPAIR